MQQEALDFGGEPARRDTRRRQLTVSQLTERLRGVLETEFFDVWVEGEISNFKLFQSSGHCYFSLKDEQAQIRAVLFRSQARLLRFTPKDGMQVLARGSVRVYPPRGEYQLQVELIEPRGKGSLQQAFEELKERLSKEGLFDPARKRPLPMLPRRIGVVTSPQGAVIRDIVRVLRRRYANLEVLVYPARVQGAEAAREIAQGIDVLNRLGGLDVVIVARGGGGLEDLWPFNEELVARALRASRLPTISAVGHETDYTIADFVADLRAPTPSAAAELVVGAKADLLARLAALDKHLAAALERTLARARARVAGVAVARVFAAEQGRLRRHAQRADELHGRSQRALALRLERARAGLRRAGERLEAFRWERQIAARRQRVEGAGARLAYVAREQVGRLRERLHRAAVTRVLALADQHLDRHARQLDELERALARARAARVRAARDRLGHAAARLAALRFERPLGERRQRFESAVARLGLHARAQRDARRARLEVLARRLENAGPRQLEPPRARLREALGRLDSLSPLRVLARGYALVFGPGGGLVRAPGDVAPGDALRIRLHGGELAAVATPKESA